MHVHVSLWVHLHVVVILAFLEVIKKEFMLEKLKWAKVGYIKPL